MISAGQWLCKRCCGNIDTFERDHGGVCYGCDTDSDRQQFYEYGNGWKTYESVREAGLEAACWLLLECSGEGEDDGAAEIFPRPELWSSAAECIGREGIVTVWDSRGRYLGCMGVQMWKQLLLRGTA